MSTENIDDLFRSQLDGHETPPGNDLWARLQAGPAAQAPTPEPSAAAPERVGQLFQRKLNAHATPPRRETWERLEDEHLRPRQRRAAAWWPMAMAAAVALLLLAGGAGLWRGFTGSAGPAGTVALQSTNGRPDAPGQFPAGGTNNGNAGPAEQSQSGLVATPASKAAGAAASPGAASQNVAKTSETMVSGLNQKNLPVRATRPAGSASSASKVGMMARQSPRRPRGTSRQPDAAAAAPLVARTTAPSHTPTPPADEPAPAPAVAVAHTPAPTSTPAGEIVPAAAPFPATASAAALAATATLITVDVRDGAARRPSLATAVATAAAATEERLGLGGRLLRQVVHAVRGERLSLSEVTGLPKNLTLEATIAGRRVSKSIQL